MLELGDLEHDGVVIVDDVRSRAELIELAKSVGEIRPHPNGEDIFTLKSSDGRKSLPGTLSKIYGLSEFPFHTDTAFWGVPARYVVMGMFRKSQCTTNYISLSDIAGVVSSDFRAEAEKSIYLVKTFEGCKYTSPVFCRNGVLGIRFDPNVMEPANGHAKKFHGELLAAVDAIEPRKVHWDGNKAIVFDNWKNLHSRSAVNNEMREIFRIYLEG